MKRKVQLLKTLLVVIMTVLFYQDVMASDANFNSGFEQGMKTAMAQQSQSSSAIQSLHPEKFINNYSPNPKETQFKGNFDAMKDEAIQSRQNDLAEKSVIQSINERNAKFNYSIDPNSTNIKNIQNKSDGIMDVITGQFGDCTKETSCTMTYQTKICEESPKTTLHYCNKSLNINVVSNSSYVDYSFIAHISTRWHNYAAGIFHLTTGEVTGSAPSDMVGSLTGRLPSSVDSSSLSVFSRDKDAYISGFELFDKNINLRVANYSKNAAIHFVIRVKTTTLSPSDQWNDDCTGLSNSGNCRMTGERCIDGSSTQVVQGLSVTRDCWEKEATYLCGRENGSSTCEPLREAGCEQVGSVCQNSNDGSCQQYTQTFRCPLKQCSDVGMICNATAYCLNGDCVQQQTKADPDFQRAVSALSAVNEASKSFSNTNVIFAGQFKSCDRLSLGFLDCCADNGWGKDHIANCTQDEKYLKTAKDNLQAVYVGQYCRKDALGLCIEKRKAYCVFPSKLARIIQAQGRLNQLNINFGDPEHANCRGITVEEFSRLNLNNMDFSDFYSEIAKKETIEDQNHLNDRVNEKMQLLAKEKTLHG